MSINDNNIATHTYTVRTSVGDVVGSDEKVSMNDGS